jgi:hypothetical protein
MVCQGGGVKTGTSAAQYNPVAPRCFPGAWFSRLFPTRFAAQSLEQFSRGLDFACGQLSRQNLK